ncbi:MAG: replication-associated recombination protein A [Oligoflexia bacterium]|nr:replication-associated recombination protein A [Oligoflexia bacterium]
MDDLFSASDSQDYAPLAERLRPRSIDDFVGHPKAQKLLTARQPRSVILWGPPGSGKTTFAKIYSRALDGQVVYKNAVDFGAKEIKQEGESAKQRLLQTSCRTILFIDEIHRLNTAQQDCLLPFVEQGHLVLIGATTENPSFEINRALLSRVQLLIFEALSKTQLIQILDRALKYLDSSASWEQLGPNMPQDILDRAVGDARKAISILELIWEAFLRNGRQPLNDSQLADALSVIPTHYDKSKERHYDTISAFIKSIRGSDPNAALIYLAIMLKGGEDPKFIARRLIISASEDIGNADPRALTVATSVFHAVEVVGLPEAAINLAQAVTYLASAPKSNRSYLGLRKAQEIVETKSDLSIPLSLRNAATGLMKGLGYGQGYRYDHDSVGGVSGQSFLPPEIKDESVYEPGDRGYEKHIRTYLDWVRERRTCSLIQSTRFT